MDLTVMIETLLKLFVIIVLGYFLNKIDILDEHTNKKLSALIVNVTSPLLILASVSGESLSENKKDVLFILLIGVIFYCLIPVLGYVILRIFPFFKKDKSIYQMLLIFSNTGFIGYPIAQTMYGDTAIFYMAILNIPFNVCIFSYGVYLVTKDSKKNEKFQWKKLLNPGIVLSVIALIIYLTDYTMPRPVAAFCSMMGDATIPMSMLVIGSSLALIPIKDVLCDKKLYLFTVVKMICLPIIIYFIAKPFISTPYILGLVTLTAALPSASLTVMLSNQYGGNTQLASKGVFLTTFCCIITIPAITYLLLI